MVANDILSSGTLQESSKTSREFNVRLDALDISDDDKRGLPIWFHPAANQELNYLNNSDS
jgi:hypothetical protein